MEYQAGNDGTQRIPRGAWIGSTSRRELVRGKLRSVRAAPSAVGLSMPAQV
jgi:hypothetical protein